MHADDTAAWTQDWGTGTEGYLYCAGCCFTAATDGRGVFGDDYETVLDDSSGVCGIVFGRVALRDLPADAACDECGDGLI
jgi:hypothetical protein